MTWFLEITCAAHLVMCVFNQDPNPAIPRYYKSEVECNRAAIVVAARWNPGSAAWRFKCLPVKQ